jgi:hypothetical protein
MADPAIATQGGACVACGFFRNRRQIEVDLGDGDAKYLSYPNVPAPIGMVVSAGKATMTELCSNIGAVGLYDLIEIIVIDAHNAKVAQDRAKKDDR